MTAEPTLTWVIRATGDAPTGRAHGPAVFAVAAAEAAADADADGPADADATAPPGAAAAPDEPAAGKAAVDGDDELVEAADLNSPLAPAGNTNAAAPTRTTTPAMMPINKRWRRCPPDSTWCVFIDAGLYWARSRNVMSRSFGDP
ncbi:hypothetical protein [Actinoplanes subtropicus]|uniref:hypothetical protein n=1 Tax=Actinoplanes subtropicus TaxID=543632 RepID=UPI000A61B9EE|nr:hypothetical protein [Actinoplanes subtropicus]